MACAHKFLVLAALSDVRCFAESGICSRGAFKVRCTPALAMCLARWCRTGTCLLLVVSWCQQRLFALYGGY